MPLSERILVVFTVIATIFSVGVMVTTGITAFSMAFPLGLLWVAFCAFLVWGLVDAWRG